MRDLITLAQLTAFDAANALAGYSNTQKQAAITIISMYIAGITGNEFEYSTSASYSFDGNDSDRIELYSFKCPLASLTSIKDKNGNVVADITLDIRLYPSVAPYEEIIWDNGRFRQSQRYTITGNWGYATVPTDVQYATFRLVSRYLTDSSFAASISGGSSIGEVKSVSIEGASVTFFGSETQTISGRTTSDQIVDKILSKYFRMSGGFTV